MAEEDFDDLESALESHWLREMHYTSTRGQGFYWKGKFFAATFLARDSEICVISFDNLQEVSTSDLSRATWGYAFFKKLGWSHLGFSSNQGNWFRDQDCINYIEMLIRQGFFKPFSQIILTGTSMGGFAALAFARLFPGCNVVAFSPQTTLDKRLVPWEERFLVGQSANWDLPYSDATQGLENANKVYVIYDNLFAPDRKQIARLPDAPNIFRLKLPGVGHKTVVALRRMELLKHVQQNASLGLLTKDEWTALARSRRNIFMYRQGMTELLKSKGRGDLATRFAQTFKARRRRLNREQAAAEDRSE